MQPRSSSYTRSNLPRRTSRISTMPVLPMWCTALPDRNPRCVSSNFRVKDPLAAMFVWSVARHRARVDVPREDHLVGLSGGRLPLPNQRQTVEDKASSFTGMSLLNTFGMRPDGSGLSHLYMKICSRHEDTQKTDREVFAYLSRVDVGTPYAIRDPYAYHDRHDGHNGSKRVL